MGAVRPGGAAGCEPGSKLAATGWVAERVAIEGLTALSDDQAHRAMDFLLDALDEIAAEVFASVAHLLNLDLDIVFVDTTSTYFEVEGPDELAELQTYMADDEQTNPVEAGTRAFGRSKDHREDLPRVVLAMAVTRDGVPVRCWTFAGNTTDTAIIRTVTDDLAGENLRRREPMSSTLSRYSLPSAVVTPGYPSLGTEAVDEGIHLTVGSGLRRLRPAAWSSDEDTATMAPAMNGSAPDDRARRTADRW
jgi:hypothetical protein